MNTPEREELPDLPEAAASFRYVTACERQLVFPGGYRDELGDEFYTADQMRAYGRLCRAGRESASLSDEEIVAAFEAAGIRIRSGETFSATGQIAQLLNGTRAILRRLSPQAGGE